MLTDLHFGCLNQESTLKGSRKHSFVLLDAQLFFSAEEILVSGFARGHAGGESSGRGLFGHLASCDGVVPRFFF